MTITRINAAPSHQHSAADITSGVLNDARLGTGDSTVALSSTYISSGTVYLLKRGRTVMANISGIKFVGHSGRQQIGTIPSGFRPATTGYGVLNASQKFLIFNPDGRVQCDPMSANEQHWGTAVWVV